jgi:Mg/Co/Ni transporter MgtE
MTFPKEMLDLADQRAKEKMKFETTLWNLQINANIFWLLLFLCNCLYSQTVIGKFRIHQQGVIVSASVSIL